VVVQHGGGCRYLQAFAGAWFAVAEPQGREAAQFDKRVALGFKVIAEQTLNQAPRVMLGFAVADNLRKFNPVKLDARLSAAEADLKATQGKVAVFEPVGTFRKGFSIVK
jgi:hypothetical protein